MATSEEYILRIRSEGPHSIPAVVRLRSFLKRLLRDHNFRAVSVVPSGTAGQQEIEGGGPPPREAFVSGTYPRQTGTTNDANLHVSGELNTH